MQAPTIEVEDTAVAIIEFAIGCEQHERNLEEIVNAIREGREPATSTRVARRAIQVICGIYESSRNGGRRVTIKC